MRHVSSSLEGYPEVVKVESAVSTGDQGRMAMESAMRCGRRICDEALALDLRLARRAGKQPRPSPVLLGTCPSRTCESCLPSAVRFDYFTTRANMPLGKYAVYGPRCRISPIDPTAGSPSRRTTTSTTGPPPLSTVPVSRTLSRMP